MGLIKLALIGGAAFYAVKTLKNEKEHGCGRRRRGQSADDIHPMTNEKSLDFNNTTSTTNPPSYPVEQYPNPPTTQYQLQQPSSLQPQRSPFQQMSFSEPQRSSKSTELVPYSDHEKQVQADVTSVPVAGSMQDDALQKAMQHLNSGDQEKARQVLAGAIGQKY